MLFSLCIASVLHYTACWLSFASTDFNKPACFFVYVLFIKVITKHMKRQYSMLLTCFMVQRITHIFYLGLNGDLVRYYMKLRCEAGV